MREGGTRCAYRETFQCGEAGEGVDCRAEEKGNPVQRTETHLAVQVGNCSSERNGEGLSKASALKGGLRVPFLAGRVQPHGLPPYNHGAHVELVY